MRLRHRDGSTVHLSYCTNVHAAEDLNGILAQLADFAEPVRERLGADRLGLGLWFARTAATQALVDQGALTRLRRELDHRGLEVVTLNAFPYTGFHAASVKKTVYRPDWTEPDRLSYTLDCARILAGLLPDDVDHGSVSTLPLAWRTPWSADRADLAFHHLDRLADGLAALYTETGRTIRVGLEPEPGCIVENVAQAAELSGRLATDHIGVCLDACHLATGFEDPVDACARLAAAGLPIVKAQASCALHIDDPADPAARAVLAGFAEERFLHQTRMSDVGAASGVLGADDLPDALGGALLGDHPWRIHFHIPVHATPDPPLRSTRSELTATLDALFGGPTALTDHVDVETYTWSVLPVPPDRAGLVDGIAAELAWTRDTLTALGLKEFHQ
ncbi:metabolite traffic protein EboE [Kitasatospora sp. NPDC057541]|uniref:metabolite traffic protein EboE n=1 Tax=unclassified Kitasatospora TaxID=2633591 RepID=UPI003688A869